MSLQVGSQGPTVAAWQRIMLARFRSYALAADGGPLKVDAYFGYDDAEVQREYERRTGQPVDGVVSDNDLRGLGIMPVIPAQHRYVGYSLPGTWGTWNIGPHCMAVNRSPNVYLQGVQWNTGAFLNPDPRHSYVEARAEGVAEFMRLALPDPRPKILSAYSMGADVAVRALHDWPANRRDEIVAVITFGSPGRPPGPTKLGPDPGGTGISGVYTPEWCRDREWSYTIDGDMYSESVGVMNPIYELLTRMEASLEFAKYLFTWLTGVPLTLGAFLGAVTAPASTLGMQLLGLAGARVPGFGLLAPILGMVTPGRTDETSGPVSLPQIMLNIPGIIAALIGLLKFLFTGAHGKYWVDPVFGGMTAENHASALVTRLTTDKTTLIGGPGGPW